MRALILCSILFITGCMHEEENTIIVVQRQKPTRHVPDMRVTGHVYLDEMGK